MLITNSTSIEINTLYNLIGEVYKTSTFMSEYFDEKFPSFSAFQIFCRQVEQTPGAFLLMAFDDEKPAGYLSLEPKRASRLKHTACLNMGVLEKYRGKELAKCWLIPPLKESGMKKPSKSFI